MEDLVHVDEADIEAVFKSLTRLRLRRDKCSRPSSTFLARRNEDKTVFIQFGLLCCYLEASG